MKTKGRVIANLTKALFEHAVASPNTPSFMEKLCLLA